MLLPPIQGECTPRQSLQSPDRPLQRKPDPASEAESELYADFSLLLTQAIDYESFPEKPKKAGRTKRTGA
jgi:hypothetical protein